METDTLYEDCQDLNEKLRINVVGNYAQGKSIFSRRLLVNRTVDKAYNETGENYYSKSLRHLVQEVKKRIDPLEQPSYLVVVGIAGVYRSGKSYLMNRLWGNMNGLVAAYLGSGENNFMSQKQMFELKVPDIMYTLLTSEVEHFSTFACLVNQMIEDGRSRMKRYMMNIFKPLLDLDHTILDGNDWKKYLWAPTCLRHELLLTDSRQDDSQIGAREKTSKSSGEKEWTNPPRAATNLLRVSAVTIIYSISDVGQIGQGEQKSKSSGEKEWMNHPRAANILLRVSAETFVFSSGDVDKKGPKEKKSKSSMYKWEHSNCSETHNTAQQEYDKIRRCSVCLDKDACVLFFPCRHMTTCEGCADVVTDCPLCRLRIKGTVKINVV